MSSKRIMDIEVLRAIAVLGCCFITWQAICSAIRCLCLKPFMPGHNPGGAWTCFCHFRLRDCAQSDSCAA